MHNSLSNAWGSVPLYLVLILVSGSASLLFLYCPKSKQFFTQHLLCYWLLMDFGLLMCVIVEEDDFGLAIKILSVLTVLQ